jgi:hypothetical protein
LRTSSGSGGTALLLITALLILPAGMAAYRASEVDFDWEKLAPNPTYRIRVNFAFESGADSLWLQTFFPQNETGMVLGTRWTDTDLPAFAECDVGGNRVVQWFGEDIPCGRIETAFTIAAERVRYDIDPAILLPDSVPGDRPFLQSTEWVQVDNFAIAALADQLTDPGMPAVQALRAIFNHCKRVAAAQVPLPPSDAVGALQLGAAGSLGASRLFMALARRVGLPARLVNGFVVDRGGILDMGQGLTPVSWVEVMLGWSWVPFSPATGLFALNDGRHIPFYRGEHELFTHALQMTVDTQFSAEPTFAVQGRLVDPDDKGRLSLLGVWGTLEGAGVPMDVLRLIIMFPLGALVSVLLRNVVGIRTFGFFLPMLVSIAALRTGLVWGVLSFLVVIALVAVLRTVLDRLSLLHLPQLALLLTAMMLGILGLALIGASAGNLRLSHVTFFPLAVLTITAERLSFMMEEEGFLEVAKVTAMSVLSIAISYLVMSSWRMQMAMLSFPELTLVIVLVDILVGRWVGLQLLEYWRFRRLLRPERVPHHA